MKTFLAYPFLILAGLFGLLYSCQQQDDTFIPEEVQVDFGLTSPKNISDTFSIVTNPTSTPRTFQWGKVSPEKATQTIEYVFLMSQNYNALLGHFNYLLQKLPTQTATISQPQMDMAFILTDTQYTISSSFEFKPKTSYYWAVVGYSKEEGEIIKTYSSPIYVFYTNNPQELQTERDNLIKLLSADTGLDYSGILDNKTINSWQTNYASENKYTKQIGTHWDRVIPKNHWVSELNLKNANISGNMPSTLGDFLLLSKMDLSGNNLSSLPDLSKTQLELVILDNNPNLSGTLSQMGLCGAEKVTFSGTKIMDDCPNAK
ncbi:MAG: hypothetical protein C4K58_04610 [Flavobacteriaceae bacterium]|nr:MAG: hypothetical protein C4K58_04610 [Flavobacteriaceae bacterium]